MIARRTVTLTFAIQGNPGLASANRARRHAFVGGRSRSYQSRESKEWRVIADTAIAEALVDARDRICPITPINVEIHSVWPRWSRRYNQPLGDVDNVAKQVLDAIVRAGIIDDDVLVQSLSLTKGYQPHMPRLEITITQTRTCHETP